LGDTQEARKDVPHVSIFGAEHGRQRRVVVGDFLVSQQPGTG
jgi:hypothetical protein